MDAKLLVTIILFGPLLGAITAGLFGRRIGNVASQAVTTGFLFLSAILSWVVFSQWTWGHLEPFTNTYAPFIHIGNFVSNWSFRLDGLSAVMLVVVTSVSSLVHLYSWGYMAEDPSKPRFFAYLSLFTFAMLSLISEQSSSRTSVASIVVSAPADREGPVPLRIGSRPSARAGTRSPRQGGDFYLATSGDTSTNGGDPFTRPAVLTIRVLQLEP